MTRRTAAPAGNPTCDQIQLRDDHNQPTLTLTKVEILCADDNTIIGVASDGTRVHINFRTHPTPWAD